MLELKEYIKAEMEEMGLTVSALKMEVLIARTKITEDAETALFFQSATPLTPYQIGLFSDKILAYVIPELLRRDDITEGGYSVKRNIAGIMAYYGKLCARLGIPNTLIETPTLTNKSNYW